MNTLVVHAHPSAHSYSRALCEAAHRGLRAGGHDVRLVDLYAEGFQPAMTSAERRAYHEAEPILDPQVRRYAADVQWAQALVFVYPTWMVGLPAMLKGWLEKTMVPGIAFHLDERTHLVKPGLRHVRRLVGITTYGGSRTLTFLMADGGRRTIQRTLRLNTALTCRRTWLGLYDIENSTPERRAEFLQRVERRMARL